MIKGSVKILLAALSLCAAACGAGGNKAHHAAGELLYKPQNAVGFEIRSAGEGMRSSVIAVHNPWQGAADVEKLMFLGRDGEQPPKGFIGAVVKAPLQRVVCMSSSYVAFLDELGEIDAVRAVSGAQYISNDTIRARHNRGAVRDIGYDSNINYELITALNPDVVFIYGVAGEMSAITNKFDELGISYFYIGDYLEQSPLGKAEWLTAFGEMFDKRAEAEAAFTKISRSYTDICKEVKEQVAARNLRKPVVMLNAPYRDVWFVPGDRNYMVRLIDDAGGVYASRGEDSDRSRPISGESAFVYAAKSDIWLNPGQAQSLAEVASLNNRFATIPAMKSGRVFNSTRRRTEGGGSDFWESGAVHPDIALQDMVKMLHPELMPDHKMYYFIRLK